MRPVVITSVAAASGSIKSFVTLEEQRRKTAGDSSPSKSRSVLKKGQPSLGKADGIGSNWSGDHHVFCRHRHGGA